MQFISHSAVLAAVLALVPNSAHALAERAPAVRPSAQETPAGEMPAQETVEARIARGRSLLEAGKPQEALPVFEEAAAAEKNSLRTRMWVLRTWLALERFEDALLAIDQLQSEGAKGPEVDYLFGMAFFLSAQRDVVTNKSSSVTGAQFDDAVRYLKKATEKDDERFRDAHAALAEAAWFTQDLATARAAVERAAKLSPGDPSVALLRGRIAIAQYAAEKDDEAKKSSAEAHWQTAVDSFQAAAKSFTAKGDAASARLAAQALGQLGNAHLWKEQKQEARDAFAQAIALDPEVAPYGVIHQALGSEAFLQALESGREQWRKAHAGSGANNSVVEATLAWWAGFANYDLKKFDDAEKSFADAVKKNPSFANSWYYIFRARYDKRDFEGALTALSTYRELDPEGLTAALQFDLDMNLARLDFLTGWCADGEKHGGVARNLDAVLLSEISIALAPEVARYWNNLGLFLRDEGDVMRGTNNGALDTPTREFDPAKVAQLWERSYEAYRKALEIEPENPAFLNDTAVILHYYLVRDLNEAKALYEKANKRATEELARTDLSPDLREWYSIAQRDSGNNLKLVQELIDKLAREKAGSGN